MGLRRWGLAGQPGGEVGREPAAVLLELAQKSSGGGGSGGGGIICLRCAGCRTLLHKGPSMIKGFLLCLGLFLLRDRADLAPVDQ